MSEETQKISGKISIERFAQGSRSDSELPALTLDDGSVVFIRIIGANPYGDDAVNAAVERIQNEAGGRVENLEGKKHRAAFFVKDLETLLQAAGLEPETKKQSQAR